MCTVSVCPAGMLTGWPFRDSVWLPAAPVIANAPASGLAGSIDQVTPVPEPAGSGSDRATPEAVPLPVLAIETVNPIGSPALTDAASAVLVTVTDAALQVIDAE